MSNFLKDHPEDYSFIVKSRAVEGGEFRPFAIANCTDCGLEHAMRGKANDPIHPVAVRKYFVKLGWDFDENNKRRCVCPSCITIRRQKRKGESPKGNNVVSITVNPSTAAPPSRTVLSVVEREKLREVLQGIFDAPAGLYIEKSDAIVAKELNMPMALVVQYRELAFGPLKSVPELEALAARIDEVEKSIRGLSDASETWQKNVTAKGLELQEILESLRRQVKDAYAKLGLPQ